MSRLAALLLVSAGALAAVPELAATPPERLRAGYLGPRDQALLGRMAEAGFNAVLVKFGNLGFPLDETGRALLVSWSDACAANGLAFLPVLNFFGGYERNTIKDLAPFVDDGGRVLAHTPDPLAAAFWDQHVTARLTGLLAPLAGQPVAAVLLDFEMYGADSTDYRGLCYSDQALTAFLEAERPGTALPGLTERAAWLAREGLADKLRAFQVAAMRRLADRCRAAVQAARPGVRLGALVLDNFHPVYEGIAVGLGTAELPVLCFSETTYPRGFGDYVTEEAPRRFAAMGAHVDFVAGLWQVKIPADAIAAHAYHCARSGFGYWIYTMQTFLQPDYQSLAMPVEDYWKAYRLANAELDRAAREPGYVSRLKAGRFHAPLPSPETLLPGLKLAPVEVARPARPALPPALRRTNLLLLWALKGERIAFDCRVRQVGTYPDLARLALVDGTGRQLAAALVGVDPMTVAATADHDGLYALAVAAGYNALEVRSMTHPAAIAVEQEARLIFATPPLYLHVPDGVRQVKLMLAADAQGEARAVTISLADGRVVWRGEVDAAIEVAIDVPDGGRGPLKLESVKAAGAEVEEDFRLKVLSGAAPAAALEPAGLFRPAP